MCHTFARRLSLISIVALGLGASAAAAQNDDRPLAAALNGANEKPAPGDPDGSGAAALRVNLGQSQVCYDLQVTNVAPATMAHIHKGPPDGAGAPVLTLTTPNAGGKSAGCVAASGALLSDMLNNPGAYYVNVHTGEFPAGAVRGQLQHTGVGVGRASP